MAVSNKAEKMSDSNYFMVLAMITLLAVGATALVGKILVSSVMVNTKLVAKKTEANRIIETDVKMAGTLVQNYESLGKDASAIANALPTYADYPQVLASSENMATATGVVLKSVSPALQSTPDDAAPADGSTATTTGATPKTADYTLSLTGSYDKLTAFLSAIEHSSRPIRVKDVQIAGTGSALNITIDASTYYQEKATLPFKMEDLK